MATVLILEDNTILAELLCAVIAQETDLIPVRAESVEEATQILIDGSPVAIITDLLLPDGSGFEVLTALRECSPAPLFVMTGIFRGTAQRRRITRGLHVEGWYEKPFDVRLLAQDLDDFAPTVDGLDPLGALEIETSEGRGDRRSSGCYIGPRGARPGHRG